MIDRSSPYLAIALATCLVSLAHCATAPSSARNACSTIPLADYSRTMKHLMADELPSAGPEIQQAIADYGELWNAVKACQGGEVNLGRPIWH